MTFLWCEVATQSVAASQKEGQYSLLQVNIQRAPKSSGPNEGAQEMTHTMTPSSSQEYHVSK